MNHRTASITTMLFIVGLINSPAAAQFRRGDPTPNDTLLSTEIHSDNRVTFRIYTPKASDVTLSGDWIGQGLGKGGNMEKDDQGVGYFELDFRHNGIFPHTLQFVRLCGERKTLPKAL